MNRKQIEHQGLNDKIHASQLKKILHRYLGKIKYLSLDCFDTLIWRKTATPADLFLDLQHQENFKSINFSASLRLNSEIKARQIMLYKQKHFEVTLKDIYREFDSSLSDEKIQLLINEELNLEKENCYAFQPIVELIRQANQYDIKVVLVSDTYLTENQLRQLLKQVLPDDVMPMIHKVFCSSEYKRSKVNGIFGNVIQSLNVAAHEILHIGDNFSADYVSPRCLGLSALNLITHDSYVADLMRLQSITANIIDPSLRHTRSLKNPFRSILAMNSFALDNPEKMIGYATLGPIMYSFSRFILDEIQALKQQGKSPKVVFIMRDAYLPSLACETLAGESVGARVRISRFAALAASFKTEEDIDRYLISLGRSNRYYDIGRQLLLTEKVVEPLVKVALRSPDPETEFVNLLHRKDILRIIFNKSAEYRKRLMMYLRKQVDFKAGDTLVFVDLGYGGTAQRQLTPMLEEEGVEVLGRYLLAVRTAGWEKNKKGLIDPSWCDDRTIRMLVSHIAMLEQLCTMNEASVVDYDEKGNEIFSESSINQQQQNNLIRIQSECLQFIQQAKQHFYVDVMPAVSAASEVASSQDLREYSLIELSRMLFLSTSPELKYLENFKLDINMGTQDVYSLFDPAKGLAGLKKRGLFYAEGNNNARRTNYPAELRSAGFELVLTSMIQSRYGLDIKPRDMLPRTEQLQAVLINGNEKGTVNLDAQATHDGYYSICAPAGTGVSLLVGKKYQWLQIESAELIEMDAFLRQSETFNTINAMPYLTLDDMAQKGKGLYECLSESAVVTLVPNLKQAKEYVFRLVFRPVSDWAVKPQQVYNGNLCSVNT